MACLKNIFSFPLKPKWLLNSCFSVSSVSMIQTLPQCETPATEEPMESSESLSPPIENGENKENQDTPSASDRKC